VTVRVRTTMSASAAAGSVIETGEAAHPARAGRLDRDGVVTPRTEVMSVWSVATGAATGWFEVHSILSVGGLVLDCAITIYRVMPLVNPSTGI
jgi:hypothetical protein